jgi:hypothetical protein
MKVQYSGIVEITESVGIWEALIRMLDDTKANALIVNDKKYFYHIMRTMGIQDSVIDQAWKERRVTIPNYGLVYIYRKQNMKGECKNAILVFPDQDLIARAEADEAIEKYSVIYDTDIIGKILSGKLVFPTDI